MGNSIKENEKGVFYNFKDEQGEIHVASLFFPEQTQNPEGIINASKDKIQQMDNLKDVSMVIASSEPKEYLGTYIAAPWKIGEAITNALDAGTVYAKTYTAEECNICSCKKSSINLPFYIYR